MEKINLTYLETLADGNNELIIELAQIFIEQVPEFIAEMNEHYTNKNWQALSAIAHKAKSSIDIMGLSELRKMLKNLEIDAKNNENTDSYKSVIAYFTSTCNNAIIECEELIKKLNLNQM